MKKLKTYEILKMIDGNPEEMIGRRYRQVGGLVGEEFGTGDIAVVTEYCGITSLGAEKFSKIRIKINGFEEWEEVKEPVSFMEAFKAYREGKEVYSVRNQYGERRYYNKRDGFYSDFHEEDIANGKWYIED